MRRRRGTGTARQGRVEGERGGREGGRGIQGKREEGRESSERGERDSGGRET